MLLTFYIKEEDLIHTVQRSVSTTRSDRANISLIVTYLGALHGSNYLPMPKYRSQEIAEARTCSGRPFRYGGFKWTMSLTGRYN
jgi:hypothetical protein